MSLAERLFTGGFSAIFSGLAMGGCYGTEQCIKGIFDDAARSSATAGDVVAGIGVAVCVAGATLLAGAGALWMAEQTIHPR
jgi:hypothetical protein